VTSGIWRPVHLRAWDHARIDNVQMVQQSVSSQQASYTAVVEINADRDQTVVVELSSETDIRIKAKVSVTVKKGMNKVELPFTITKSKLWWSNGLGEAFLYQISSSLKLNNAIIDCTHTSLGVRTVKLVQKPDDLATN
jgi:beta-mannosidase